MAATSSKPKAGSASSKQQQRQNETVSAFQDRVNMTAPQVESWLKTDESKSVGRKRKGEDEAVGHASGRRIVAILRKKKADYDDEDLAHMRKVVGYIKRHLKQRPDGDVSQTRWRYSLMNWGHDPLKR